MGDLIQFVPRSNPKRDGAEAVILILPTVWGTREETFARWADTSPSEMDSGGDCA